MKTFMKKKTQEGQKDMRRTKASIAASALILSLSLVSSAALACTSIIVTPGASVDGTASVTHTCDSGNSAYELYKVPAQDWEPGTMIDVNYIPQYTMGYQQYENVGGPTGNMIPQVDHTYSYIKSGLFGIINEKQVSIGETTIGGRRELSNANGYFDITNLSQLALERGATAREAIQIMGELGETYGYKDGGEMLAVADTEEAWIFEMIGPGPLWTQGDDAPGAFWVAQRIPDGCIGASANAPMIDVFDPEDTENFLCSPGIKEYAIEQGWYDPASGEEFSWRDHFMNANDPIASGRRVWRVFTLAAPSLVGEIDEADLPVYVKPDQKLSIDDINAIQRDHYEDTEFDGRNSITAGPWNNPRRFRGLGFKVDGVSYSWQRMIAQVQCEYTITTVSRGWLPDEIGGMVWYGAGNPDLTCYVPLYACMTELSPSISAVGAGSHQEFTRGSYWWAINAVSTYANMKWEPMSADVKEWIAKYEGQVMATQEAIESAALSLYEQDPALAAEFLTKYCNENVETVRDAWWELLDFLVWKYNMGFVTENGRVNTVSYPEDWLRKVIELDEPDHFKS